MPERFEIPRTSSTTAEQVYKSLMDDPEGLIQDVVLKGAKDNPWFIDAMLASAAGMYLTYAQTDARQLLMGVMYRYRCFEKESRERDGYISFVDQAKVHKAGLEFIRLSDLAVAAQSSEEVMLRQMIMRLHQSDHQIGVLLESLASKPFDNSYTAFVQGVFGAQLILSKAELIFEPEDQPASDNLIVPRVSLPVVRENLVNSVMDPNFVANVLEKFRQYSPLVSSRFIEAPLQRVPYPEVYQLLASFVIQCFMEEAKNREEEFPKIDGPEPRDPKVARALENQDLPTLSRLLQEGQDRCFDEIERTNTDLFWGIDTYLLPLALSNRLESIAGRQGVVNSYTTIRWGYRNVHGIGRC